MSPPPWYRQFWPWVLLLLPATAVVAGLATVWIAVQAPDAGVVDDYYRKGLAINQDLARERRAAELGLRARLAPVDGDGGIELRLQARERLTQPALRLRLVHPTVAARDRELVLARVADGVYRGRIDPWPPGRWLLRLEPLDEAWRLGAEVVWDGATPLRFEAPAHHP